MSTKTASKSDVIIARLTACGTRGIDVRASSHWNVTVCLYDRRTLAPIAQCGGGDLESALVRLDHEVRRAAKAVAA